MRAFIKSMLHKLAMPDPTIPVDTLEPLTQDEIKYIPNRWDVIENEITPPQICSMNEGDRLCIHRSHSDASKLIHANQFEYTFTGEDVEPCPYMDDHDHYPVTKNV